MSTEDRKKLTVEEAYSLVREYVNSFWGSYKVQLGGFLDAEDVVQDVMLKLTTKKPNPDYDPNWKPGEVASVKVGRSEDSPRKSVSTEYMLKPQYDPEDPYDAIYHLIPKKEFTYLDKYDGRTTSKKYYIKTIVQNNLNDKVDKRDRARYSSSIDAPDEEGLTLGDRLADPDSEEKLVGRIESKEVLDLLKDILASLDSDPLSDRIQGWSPITGEESNGEKIEAPLTARDIGIFIMYGYSPNEVAQYYHDVRSGKPISPSTLSKKWADALNIIKKAIQDNELTADLWKDRTGKPKR